MEPTGDTVVALGRVSVEPSGDTVVILRYQEIPNYSISGWHKGNSGTTRRNCSDTMVPGDTELWY